MQLRALSARTKRIQRDQLLPTRDMESHPLAQVVKRQAQFLIRRLPHSSTIQYDDLHSAGLLALVEAAGRFDASRGVNFTLYAHRRIRGAMLDELRQRDTVSRDRRAAIRSGKDNTDAPHPMLVDLVAAMSVEDPEPSAETNLTKSRLLARLDLARARLPERLRRVLRMRLELDYPLKKIASDLKVTQGRACQLVAEGIRRLRSDMGPEIAERAALGG